MIELSTPVEDSDEARAARDLRDLIVAAWPWADSDNSVRIFIAADVKCHGRTSGRDIDVVLLAQLPPGRAIYAPFLPTLGGGKPSDPVGVESLCLAIEVKDHDPSGSWFVGTHAMVRYNGQPHSATDQNDKQVQSLRWYLETATWRPWVTGLIWLRHKDRSDLPDRPHNVVGADPTWELFLNVIGQLRPPQGGPDGRALRAWSPEAVPDFARAARALTVVLQPTRLDRYRMDLIAERAVKEEWSQALGTRQLVFRGQGGTGKTVLLLQLARREADAGRRVLLLTYNTALVADLTRLMTLMGVPDPSGGSGVRVQTVHSFMRPVFDAMDVRAGGADSDGHAVRVVAALEMFDAGAATAADVAAWKAKRPDDLDWDRVFIDEAQDWPPAERDLLRHLYPTDSFAVALGPDQLVRTLQSCDWQAGLPKARRELVTQTRCLRMKPNLVRFANDLASLLQLPGWNFQPDERAAGGRVVVVRGDYFADPALHADVVAGNAADGNQPIDMLACVPPGLVRDAADGRRSAVADRFEALGQPVWDGVDPDVRRTYPLSSQVLRVVQYDSCRGLEGWAVLCFGLDEFYEYKLSEYARSAPPGEFADDPDGPRRHAGRWLMIALSRAVDTLVLQVSDRPSALGDALNHLAAQHPDFVSRYSSPTNP